jgi:predicted TIM-barrel fold metal-dependent hydrolase
MLSALNSLLKRSQKHYLNNGMMTKMKIITLEEHTSDLAIAKASREAIVKTFPNILYMNDPEMTAVPPLGTLDDIGEGRIADMDAAGITMQILSYSTQPQVLAPSEAVHLTRDANDRLAEVISARPGRFGGFATLPWSDPATAAKELERAVIELKLKGVLITGRPSADAVFLDDKRYWPVLEKAAELKVPVYIHPGFPTMSLQKDYYSGFSSLVDTAFSLFGWGWHSEAGIQVIRMILAGVFEEYPDLQVISGHWGEMVPFFLERLDYSMPPSMTGLPRTISDYFRKHVYVTPSGMFNYSQLRFIMDEVGVDRILYSADYPYLPEKDAADFLLNAPISEEEKEKIAYRNAEKLLNL